MEFNLEQLESHIPAEGRMLWNQSYYFNAYDPRTKIGCVIRAGFQEALGAANSWLVFFIDGKLLFQRFNANLPCPTERLTQGVSVGGMKLESVEALKAARVTFSTRDFSFELIWRAMHPLMDAIAFGHGKTEIFASSLAGAHLEGSCFVEGRVTVRGGQSFEFNGTGARDIAAGVRDWDGMEHYRVAWPIFADNTAIIGIRGISQGRDSYMSMLHDGAKWTRVVDTKEQMEFERDSMTVTATEWSFADEDGRAWAISGKPLFRCFLPAETYVLAEHIAQFTRADGAVGYGLIECGFSLPWPKAA